MTLKGNEEHEESWKDFKRKLTRPYLCIRDLPWEQGGTWIWGTNALETRNAIRIMAIEIDWKD